MVRLSGIPELPAHVAKGAAEAAPAPSTSSLVEGARMKIKEQIHVQLAEYKDEFTTSVYGSRFAGMDLPRHRIPEDQMPKDIAYRMIRDELSLDNNPRLK